MQRFLFVLFIYRKTILYLGKGNKVPVTETVKFSSNSYTFENYIFQTEKPSFLPNFIESFRMVPGRRAAGFTGAHRRSIAINFNGINFRPDEKKESINSLKRSL